VVLVWIVFLLFVLLLLALDLGVFHRRAHVVSVREALAWSVVWVATALAFSAFVYFGYEYHWLGLGLDPDPVERSAAFPEGRVNDGGAAVLKFLTGYVVEKSLSVDNVFVIAMLFGYFGVPRLYQHRVLFWGILGALAMRGAMIALGARLVAEFSWVLYVFGAVLILTAGKMMLMNPGQGDPGQTAVIRLIRRFLPVTDRFHGEHFFVRAGSAASHEAPMPGGEVVEDPSVGRVRPGTLMLTPLALALVMVETTDLVFAVDSIPAIFAITADPFLVFTSNVFAILGLRSLYFALAGALHAFEYLKHALAVVLVTVGVKMLAHSWLKDVLGPNFNLYLLATVLLILAVGVLASVVALRWRTRAGRAVQTGASSTGRRIEQLIAPDDLIAIVQRAGLMPAAWGHDVQRAFSKRLHDTGRLAKDVMTADPVCCTPATPLDQVARLMVRHDCGEIPVIDSARRPLGVVTDRDIVSRVVARGGDPRNFDAGACMSEPPVTVRVDAPFRDVVVMMEAHQIRRIPVVDEQGCCAGIISQADVAREANAHLLVELVQQVSRHEHRL
jgi:tellurite resistance protein TerC